MDNLYLIIFVILYLLVSIGIGLYASKKVKNENDYILAGRSLPLYIVIATVFATWFGSETVLGTSSTFIDEGLIGIMADPFGAALCLILVGIFFARPLYKLGITTLGDFYKLKYGRTVEMLASICILISYIGWISAQIVALGIVFNVLSGGLIPAFWGAWLGASIVLIYTFWGGMWSVALNDFMQMIMIVIGIIIATFFITSGVGGITRVIEHANSNGKFDLFPSGFSFFALASILFALLTMGFGSIPQQDVFQRVLSAKNEKTAMWGSIIGGILYLLIAFLPIMLGYAAFIVAPDLIDKLGDSQLILPTLILQTTPLIVQIVFFGALISAIMSTASATLLAPSALFTYNILKPFINLKKDKQLLKLTRFVVLGCFFVVMGFVTYKFQNQEANIFNMVEEAYKVTLAGAFIPLVAGFIVKKTHTISGLLSLIFGIGVWLAMENIDPEHMIPPQFWGMFASIIGFILGQILGKIYGTKDEK